MSMSEPKHLNLHARRTARAGQRPFWSGLLLGFLLIVFVAAFAYVAYLFLSWGQLAAAQAPDLPPLALPKLVRPVSANDSQAVSAAAPLFQPAGSRPQEVSSQTLGRTTILVMGVDARPGAAALRTDSIIVATINPQTGSAGMLSIPRDMAIRAPVLNRTVKVNTLYGLGAFNKLPGGGPGYLRDTLSEFLGYPIDYYVTVNFEGFKQVVDLIGGVDIDVTKEIYDDQYPDDNYGYEPPVHFLPGRQHMDGATALKYARTRHADNDYFRADRQQQVIMAIKERITQPGQMAALLPRLPGLAIAMANSVQTDMPVDKAIALARQLDKVDLQKITRVVIDQKMGTVVQNDPALGYVLTPDMNKVRAAATAVFADAPVGPSSEDAAREAVRTEAARIIVLNGTPEKGLAAKTQASLITNGFNVVTVGNADRVDYSDTWLVMHGNTTPATVEALVRWFMIPPDRVRSEPPSDQADVSLIVGLTRSRLLRREFPRIFSIIWVRYGRSPTEPRAWLGRRPATAGQSPGKWRRYVSAGRGLAAPLGRKGSAMRLREIMTLAEARSLSLNLTPNLEVRCGFAADLMSDVLRYDLSQALLLSGLANPQIVRTAEMADVAVVLMVRGKIPPPETLDLAEEVGIPILTTELTMFETCGRLSAAGLPACKRNNG